MPLSSGSRLGDYEIVSMIGRGGMGEVYRARDSRLGRDVAIKLLPDTEASDPEWRAGLEREARALASLNHPNIAAIYGLQEASVQAGGASTTGIVMELVDGDTLAARLQGGPLPLDEVLRLAEQIADALDAAHQNGIVHRDLKPANIKITPAGTVKLLDFGLAKFLADPARDAVTLSAVSARAVVTGTPAYMAPEQAEGKSVDRRADVWAFGILLYEMATGERPFRGESLPETLAAVLSADVQWAKVPSALQPLLRACLERNRLKRLRDIGDYRFLLRTAEAAPAPIRPAPRHSLLVAIGAVAAVAVAFFAGKSVATNQRASSPPAPIRLSTMLPAGVSVTRGPGYTSSVAVSPDGRTIVIAATDKDGRRLYRRSLDRLDPTPLAGTEGASSPFFSWNGKWIGFFANGRLKRMLADGGPSLDIAAAPGFSSGASWGPDDRIVFAYGADSHLQVVAAEGGRVDPLTNQTAGRQPEVLPDGRTVLFEAAGNILAYDGRTGAITKLQRGTAPRYANGYVIFSRGTTLLAAPIDIQGLSMGAAIPVTEGVAVELPGSGGGGHYAVSRSGALVYVPAADTYELVMVGPNAVDRVVGQQQRSLENPRFSPDGRYLVVASRRRDDEPTDLWLHDLHARTATRLTSDGGRAPVWADGTTITYSHLGEQQGIYTMRVDSGGARRQVLAVNTFHWLIGWTPDRSTLLYGQMNESSGSSIMAYSHTQSRTVIGPGNTWGGRLSHDGKWLAYYVLESGVFEIYVTRFPETGARWLIAEGTDPSWSPDGNEIYYRSGPRLVAARIDKAAGVTVASNRVVVDPFLPPLYDDYDIHPDGRTVVTVRPVSQTQGREVTMVLNWFSELPQVSR